MATELPPSPFEPAVRDAAWHIVGFEIFLERLRRRLRRPEHAGVEAQLVAAVHEALAATVDGEWTEEADRRLRAAYQEAASAVGLEPWH
jgi:hypothetical protein